MTDAETPDVRDRVAEASGTELDRLGSSKLLVALTDADLSTPAVLAVAAGMAAGAATAYREYADAATGDRAREAFAAAADAATDRERRVRAALPEGVDARPDPTLPALRAAGDDAERLGAVVGRSLVADRTLAQVVGFFVNEADGTRADLFRAAREAAGEDADRATDRLADRPPADRDRAAAVADGVVAAAYREYADRLEAMGVDAKPVC